MSEEQQAAQQQPCQHCEGKGLIAQPDGSVVVCPEANGPGHY